MSVSRKKGGSSIHFMNPFIVEVDGGGIKQVPAVPNFSSQGSAFPMESVNLDRISESPKAFPVCVRSASRLFFVLRLKLHSLHRAVFQYVYDVSESASVCHPLPSVFTQRQVRLIQSQEILRVAVAEHGASALGSAPSRRFLTAQVCRRSQSRIPSNPQAVMIFL